MAAAWLDDRDEETLFLARGIGRPLWIGEGSGELFFASTRKALELVERYTGVRLRKRELGEGTFLAVADGSRPADRLLRARPQLRRGARSSPPSGHPEEGRSALARLAAIATPATAR